jgi:hypothetical protein
VSYQGNGWRPTAITRFVEGLRTAAAPIRVETDLGEGFLKVLGNPEGPHALARELVGSLAADWLGLPTLDFSLIRVVHGADLPLPNGAYAQAGMAFISRAEENVFAWGGDVASLENLSNIGVLAGLVVADTWLSNFDRYAPDGSRANRSNVFLIEYSERHRGMEFRAMDFTHAFTWGEPVDQRLAYAEKISDQRVYGLFPEFKTVLLKAETIHRASMRGFAEKLSSFNHSDADRIVKAVPRDWNISDPVRQAWRTFLVERARFVARTVELSVWPQLALEGFND